MPWVTAVALREDVEHAQRSLQLGHDAMTHCPLARTLCRALGLALGRISVEGDLVEAYAWKAYERLKGVPTNKMIRAIVRFDETGEMKPSIFRIKLEPMA